MTKYTHGGDVWRYPEVKKPLLDFSANMNPLGMPASVCAAAQEAVADSAHYPDPFCRKLTSGIALRDKVLPQQVLCGNGAADLIFRLVYACRPSLGMITAPAFSEYEQALSAAGCEVVHYKLYRENQFRVTEEILNELSPDLDMLFLCNPNNPTGQTIDQALLLKILEACADRGIRLVLDECFLELSDYAKNGGLAGYVNTYPNLFLLRAFTKSYATAGLRLGYALCGDAECLENMCLAAQPWSVSAPAQAAGIAALHCPEHTERAVKLIKKERKWLTEELSGLKMLVFPSQANYLLFQHPGDDTLKARLLKEGILIRSCGNYRGLGDDYYRIAVKTEKENNALLGAMRKVL